MENIIVDDKLLESFLEIRKQISILTIEKDKIRNAILEQNKNISSNHYDIRIEEKFCKDYKAICLHYLNMDSIENDSFLKKITYVCIDEKNKRIVKG